VYGRIRSYVGICSFPVYLFQSGFPVGNLKDITKDITKDVAKYMLYRSLYNPSAKADGKRNISLSIRLQV